MSMYVLITGASGGLGLEFAKIFARKGKRLILVARNQERLNEVREFIEDKYAVDVVAIQKDLSSEQAVQELYHFITEKNLEVDILINNAGFGDCNCFLDTPWERQKNMIDVNITALAHLAYLFGQDMRKRKCGKILNVASLASFCAGPYMSVYYASKSFVRSFSEALSEELREFGVTVTALCPGPVATGFEKNAHLENVRMFKILKVADPAQVAEKGYDALMRGKALVYVGAMTKWMNLASRLFSREKARKLAMYVNGERQNR